MLIAHVSDTHIRAAALTRGESKLRQQRSRHYRSRYIATGLPAGARPGVLVSRLECRELLARRCRHRAHAHWRSSASEQVPVVRQTPLVADDERASEQRPRRGTESAPAAAAAAASVERSPVDSAFRFCYPPPTRARHQRYAVDQPPVERKEREERQRTARVGHHRRACDAAVARRRRRSKICK